MRQWTFFLATGWLCAAAGCGTSSTPSTSASGEGSVEIVSETVAVEAVAPVEAKPADASPATETKEAPEPKTTDAPTAGGAKVVLGGADLTSGLPGEGELSVEEIRAWLDDPKNHEVLEVELPQGLSEGQAQIKGLDANPLTRAKVELGRQLYFDPRLSAEDISCASCHNPDEGFAHHARFGIGIKKLEGNRNSPISYNRILSDKQFWDGRAASLEEQAKGPIANPIEMGNTHDACVGCLAGIEGYKIQFEKIFGEPVNIDNVAEAIASFERTLVSGPSPYDYQKALDAFAGQDLESLKEDDPELYAEYEKAKAAAAEHPMSESALRGMKIYFSEKGNCSACHVGPNLTDELYYNIGVGMDAEKPDLGRYEISKDEKDKGAFKTPTIRNVEFSAPYMHDGSQKTLEEVVEWYAKGGHPNPHLHARIKKLDLTDQDKADLVAFMKSTSGAFTPVRKDRLPKS